MLENNPNNSNSIGKKDKSILMKKSDYNMKKPVKSMVISKNSSVSYST